MLVQDIADEIYREIGEPEGVSIASISFWLQSNVGRLNILLNLNPIIVTDSVSEEFTVQDPNTKLFGTTWVNTSVNPSQTLPAITFEQKDILKHLYYIHYLSRLISINLGAASYDWSEISEGDSRVRRVSKNEIAKTYQQMRTAFQNELNDYIFYYKQNNCGPYVLSSWNFLYRLDRMENTNV